MATYFRLVINGPKSIILIPKKGHSLDLVEKGSITPGGRGYFFPWSLQFILIVVAQIGSSCNVLIL